MASTQRDFQFVSKGQLVGRASTSKNEGELQYEDFLEKSLRECGGGTTNVDGQESCMS